MKVKGLTATVRAAIKGWGPTLRLISIMATATVCMIVMYQTH